MYNDLLITNCGHSACLVIFVSFACVYAVSLLFKSLSLSLSQLLFTLFSFEENSNDVQAKRS